MALPTHVIVVDTLEREPSAQRQPWEYEGQILDGNTARLTSMGRQVATLPVEPELVHKGGGWTKRSFGKGLVFSDRASTRDGYVVMPLATGFGVIHWMVEVASESPFNEMKGRLQLVTDQQHVQVLAGMQQHMGGQEFQGGPGRLLICGEAKMNMIGSQIGGFALYGTIVNARVRWFAMTQTR